MIKNFSKLFKAVTADEIFGFITPSVCLKSEDMLIIDELLSGCKNDYVEEFEQSLSNFIGLGQVITFGSGRMAFYSLMKEWNIGKGDEVILTGFTCAVMVNAVLRIGAKPVFADIDKDTLGLSVHSLERAISQRTKLIVAQHSFGIPCEIDAICKLAKEKGIYVVEDCAITLGSVYKKRMLGTWGDAAIFSTDHTKPINTLIGGYLYTENQELAARIRIFRNSCEDITKEHAMSAVKQYIFENKIEHKKHKCYVLWIYMNAICQKLHLPIRKLPYLQHESSSSCFANTDYPYPARLHPAFAYIGIKSLEQYKESIQIRREWLKELLEIIKNEDIPQMYFNPDADIVPLRLAYVLKKNNRDRFTFIDDWVWFKQPIVATSESLDNFGYYEGACPTSEQVGKHIMNLPMVMIKDQQEKFLRKLKKIYR